MRMFSLVVRPKIVLMLSGRRYLLLTALIEVRSRYCHDCFTGDASAVVDDTAFLPGMIRLPIPQMNAISPKTAHRINEYSTDRSWLWYTVLRYSQEPLSLVHGSARATYPQCGCKVAASLKFWMWRGPRSFATEVIVNGWEAWCGKKRKDEQSYSKGRTYLFNHGIPTQ